MAIGPSAVVIGMTDGMSIHDKLCRQLKRDEGIRLKPYEDSVGKLTIGVGRNLSDKGISMSEAILLLASDVAEASGDLLKALPWMANLGPIRSEDEARRGAFINLTFNMGINGLLSFINMLGYARNHQWDKVAEHLLKSKYAEQVGDRAVRLAEQLRTGVWQ